MRKLFAILTMLAALILASVTAFAAPSLVDNAKVLTPAAASGSSGRAAQAGAGA